jgi:hypothetical protein
MKQSTKDNLTLVSGAALVLSAIFFASHANDYEVRPLPSSGVPDNCQILSAGRTPAMKCK